MPIFGFLASLAAPLLKPVAEVAWSGIKKVGKELFDAGKEKIIDVGKDVLQTVGNQLSGNTTTVGQVKTEDVKPIIQQSEQTDSELQEKIKNLQAQEAIFPTVQQFAKPYERQFDQQAGLYKNYYPEFTKRSSFKQQFNNGPGLGFQSKINITRRRAPLQSSMISDQYQNQSYFKSRYSMPNQNFLDQLQEREVQVESQLRDFQNQSLFERQNEDMNYRDIEEELPITKKMKYF